MNDLARRDLVSWCQIALAAQKMTPARHHRLLLRELEDIASGENNRLIVEMPPGSAKSTYVSDLFPPWFMRRERGLCVIAASHTSGLAEYFSRRAMGRIEAHGDTLGISLRGEAVESWFTSNGSEYKAAGVGGSITGRRADLGIIDDPVKGREQADSPGERERMWEWYKSDFLTRLKPTGRIVLVMTRWHEDDLCGRILEREASDWRVIRVPMEAEADDPLGREEGERLWPDYFTDDMVAKAKLDSRSWASLFQQRPAPAEGALFQAGKIVFHEVMPPVVRRVRAWDLAATEAGSTTGGGAREKKADPDWTVGLLLAKTDQGRFVVEDVVRVRGGPDMVERTVVETAARDGRGVPISMPQDPGQAGKAQASYFVSRLAGYQVATSRETGNKATRAMPVASQCNAGNLGVLRSPVWNSAFIEELRNFPAGRWDDQVDALSRAFGEMVIAAKPAHGARIPHMAR